MNRIILLLAIVCGPLTISLNAQKIKWGVKGGVFSSDMRIASNKSLLDELSVTSNIGIEAGLTMEILLNSNLSLQIDPTFVRKSFGETSTTMGFKFSVITVPVMLKYKVIERLYIITGPEVGYYLSSGIPLNFDLGASIGVGYQITEQIGIQSRFYYGLKAMFDIQPTVVVNVAIIDTAKQYNKGFGLSLSYTVSQ